MRWSKRGRTQYGACALPVHSHPGARTHPRARTHTHAQTCYIYCFFTVIMVAWTRFSVTLYVIWYAGSKITNYHTGRIRARNHQSQTNITGSVSARCRYGTYARDLHLVIYVVYMRRFPRPSSTYTDTSFQHVTITSFLSHSYHFFNPYAMQAFPQKKGIKLIQITSSGKNSWRLHSSKTFSQCKRQSTKH